MENPKNPIRSVKNITNCACSKGRVLVTFADGSQTVVHDDGSFWPWTGGQNVDERHEPIIGKASA